MTSPNYSTLLNQADAELYDTLAQEAKAADMPVSRYIAEFLRYGISRRYEAHTARLLALDQAIKDAKTEAARNLHDACVKSKIPSVFEEQLAYMDSSGHWTSDFEAYHLL